MAGHSDDLLAAIKREIMQALICHGVPATDASITTDRACARILRVYGGDRQWLPKCDRTARNAVIVEDMAAGKSPEHIAKNLTISRRTVLRVSKRAQVGLGREDWVL